LVSVSRSTNWSSIICSRRRWRKFTGSAKRPPNSVDVTVRSICEVYSALPWVERTTGGPPATASLSVLKKRVSSK